MQSKIKAGIVGGAGYTGGETLRLLLQHPVVVPAWVHSKSQAGLPVHSVHTDLFGDTDLYFSSEFSWDIEVVFLCLGHGEAARFLNENSIPNRVKIIDLSQDFRLNSGDFVYGLVELHRNQIKQATKIANPGCFATAIQLALLPLAKAGLIPAELHIQATTGSTGAGQHATASTHHSWRNNNLSVYKAFEHQHLLEIRQSLAHLQTDLTTAIHFIPQRGDFTRGILATVYLDFSSTEAEAFEIYEHFYLEHPFTHVSAQSVHLKQVVNTNKCLIHLQKIDGKLLITSIIDNLLKGASGQAVQNMNLLLGLDETFGLQLKASAY